MKRNNISVKYLFYFLIAFVIMACSNNLRHNLVLSHYQYRFGNVKQGELCTGVVRIYNKGSQELHIRQVRGDCGCTTVFIDKRSIAVKDSATLHFTLDTKNKKGEVENYIIIEANTDSVIHYVQLLATVE